MSKGTILSSGYYSLNSALLELHKLGWNIIKLHGAENPTLKDIVDDRGPEFGRVLGKALEKADGKLRKCELDVLNTYGVGGRPFSDSLELMYLMAGKFCSNVININESYKYFVDLHKKINISAALVHTAEGGTYGTLAEASKHLGIPFFCCYNGTLSRAAPKYCAHTFYDAADMYYLHGEYDINFVKNRQLDINIESFPIVGQPAFDQYYPYGNHNPEPNTFLFCATTVCITLPMSISGPTVATVHMSEFGIYRKTLNVNNDGMFFKAFAKYQKNVNPDAKLFVSLRPSYNLTSEYYASYVKSFGMQNFEVFEHEHRPARDLIREAEYLISAESTILMEGIINRKPIMYLIGLEDDDILFDGSRDWSIPTLVADEDATVENLILLTEKKHDLISGSNKWAEYYNHMDDGQAGRRLAEDLDGRLQ